MCLHTKILWIFVAQEFKRGRYSESYKFDQGNTSEFRHWNLMYRSMVTLDILFMLTFSNVFITEAKSRLHGDG